MRLGPGQGRPPAAHHPAPARLRAAQAPHRGAQVLS
nr:hypothetical protein [Leptothrix sp. C29]